MIHIEDKVVNGTTYRLFSKGDNLGIAEIDHKASNFSRH
jgi:hypothetical protein